MYSCSSRARSQCAVPENIHTPPHRRDWNFLGGGGFCKVKTFKEMYEVYLEFPSVGEVWIFSGITQCDAVGLLQLKPANKILCKFMKQKHPMFRTLRFSTKLIVNLGTNQKQEYSLN